MMAGCSTIWKAVGGALATGGTALVIFAAPACAQSGVPTSTNGPFSSDVNTAGGQTPTKAHPLDLNSTSAAELSALPGIGAARAKAIVDGRPYRDKDELVRRMILPQDIYNRVKDLMIAKQG
jgi:DNA uptake protein ComE-like DNA-binding protein